MLFVFVAINVFALVLAMHALAPTSAVAGPAVSISTVLRTSPDSTRVVARLACLPPRLLPAARPSLDSMRVQAKVEEFPGEPSPEQNPTAEERAAYLDELLRKAEEQRLWDDPYWHTLLHYKGGLLGLRSLVDDPKFFASPDGKKNPAAELRATLRAFFTEADSFVATPIAATSLDASVPESDGATGVERATGTYEIDGAGLRTEIEETVGADAAADTTPSHGERTEGDAESLPDTTSTKHPVCRFPARLEWLTETLDIDRSRLPVPTCESFETFHETIGPQSASLIFPTSHMNSPASMYGHTLLTIQGSRGTELLSYAVNYSAVTNETFGPFYIVRGLFGLYPGYFSILPYYAKLQQYGDVDDRDIWEYPLNLDAAEIRRLLAHVYELENIYSDYFFFNENCSYDLLFLLDAARPSLNITDQFGWWVIPLDTIRAVKANDLVEGAMYRPSKSTKIEHLGSLLSKDERRLAVRVAKGKAEAGAILDADVPHETKVRIADLAGEYLQYIYAKGQLPQDQYTPRFLQTLRTRSSLGEAGDWRYSIPPPGRPDLGHRSSRLTFGAGVRDETYFQELQIRPVYHDLLDGQLGFEEGSEIVFVEAAVRYYPRADEVLLERLDLIHITSIAPRNEFFAHTSWKVETGFLRRRLESGRRDLVYGLNTAFGRAYRSFVGLPYLMIETDLQVGGALRDNYSAGVGASAGTVFGLASWWKVHAQAQGIFYRLGERDDRLRLILGQGLRVTTNWNLSIEAERITEQDVSIWDSKASVRFFF